MHFFQIRKCSKILNCLLRDDSIIGIALSLPPAETLSRFRNCGIVFLYLDRLLIIYYYWKQTVSSLWSSYVWFIPFHADIMLWNALRGALIFLYNVGHIVELRSKPKMYTLCFIRSRPEYRAKRRVLTAYAEIKLFYCSYWNKFIVYWKNPHQ